jgi:uncharacterized protein
MPQLKERLRTDLTASMKSRDALRSSTLRLALTAITNAEVAGQQARTLSDEQVIGVLSSEAKKRREAAAAFDSAQRPTEAAKERAEAAILAEYLPEQLTGEQISEMVTAAVRQSGAEGEGIKAMGRVMGQLQPQVKGRADGAAVAAEVRRQLAAG